MSLVGKERVKGKNLTPLHQYILHVLEAHIHKRHFWKYGIRRGENLSVTFWHDIHYGGKKVELGRIMGQAVIGQHEDGSQTQAWLPCKWDFTTRTLGFSLEFWLGLQFHPPPPPPLFLLVRVLNQKTYVNSTETFGLVWTRKQCRIKLWYFVNKMNAVTSLF